MFPPALVITIPRLPEPLKPVIDSPLMMLLPPVRVSPSVAVLEPDAERRAAALAAGAARVFASAEEAEEALRGEPVDAANFRRDALATGLLEDTGELHSEGVGRPGKLYRRRAH